MKAVLSVATNLRATMAIFVLPRRRPVKRILESPVLLTGIGIVTFAVIFLLVTRSYVSPVRQQKAVNSRSIRNFGPSVSNASIERFATLFHYDLVGQFKLDQDRSSALIDELVATLRDMEAVGITTIVYSSPWEFLQPTDGPIRFDYLDLLVSSACQNTKLKVRWGRQSEGSFMTNHCVSL